MSDFPLQLRFELQGDDYRLVERVSRRARNLRVEVRPDGEVRLVYPRWVSRSRALAFLHERDGWVREKLGELQQQRQQRAVPRLSWDDSDVLLYEGRRLPLLRLPALGRPQLRIGTEQLELLAPAAMLADAARLETVLRQGLLRQAKLQAARLLEEEAARLGVRHAGLRVNDPRTQWGSCNPGGLICLSWRLLLAPPAVFRYVAVHELCHLVHRDHSSRFWALVGRQMPDYEEHRRWLRDEGTALQDWLPRLQRGP
ncbi:MAG TPA: SprT family zinc-dependent metalloprotease [Solimonas sp.]|nr:SprT family zinc-dependent metalloprotease [Solimonas sp.]